MNEPNETEKAFASLGITGFCNPCYMPSVEWIDGKPYYPAYAARDALEKRVAQYEMSLAKLKKELAELCEATRWRKFSEEKPDDKQWILVYYGYENNGCRIDLRRWDNGCKYDVEFQELYTHWMPLPKVPEGK